MHCRLRADPERAMQVFTCSTCRTPIYFENFLCTSCGAKLAFLPELRTLSVLEGRPYRMCKNSVEHAACNWAVAESDSEELCLACRLNASLPGPELREG